MSAPHSNFILSLVLLQPVDEEFLAGQLLRWEDKGQLAAGAPPASPHLDVMASLGLFRSSLPGQFVPQLLSNCQGQPGALYFTFGRAFFYWPNKKGLDLIFPSREMMLKPQELQHEGQSSYKGVNSLLFIDHPEDLILAVLPRVNQRRKDILLSK